MTGCAGCGACCEVIPWARESADELPENLNGAHDEVFLAEHWHRISREEALSRNPRFSELDEAHPFWECDQYDPGTHRCRAHDTKPRICSGFPWYGVFAEYAPELYPDVSPIRLSPFPRCSFWHDIPRDEWPSDVDPLPGD